MIGRGKYGKIGFIQVIEIGIQVVFINVRLEVQFQDFFGSSLIIGEFVNN